MRKVILATAVSTLVAGTANATIARIKALGNQEIDSDGSYFLKDSRNIFLNPAAIHDFANTVTIEWGERGSSVDYSDKSNTTLNKDEDPKAQGGFLKKSGNFVYGVYLGNESDTSSMLRVLASSPVAVAQDATAVGGNGVVVETLDSSDNQVDFFFGGGSDSLKWGTNFLYSKSEDKGDQKEEDEAMAVRFGAKAKSWDAHLNLSLKSQAKETVDVDGTALDTAIGGGAVLSKINHEFDGKLGVHAGGAYHMGKNTFWGYYKTFKWDQKDDSSATALNVLKQGKNGTSEGSFNTIQLGWANKINTGKGMVFTQLYLDKKNVELQFAEKTEVNVTKVPLVLGYEAQATDWLTIRGSVTHNVYGKRDNKNLSKLNGAATAIAKAVFGDEGEGSTPNSTSVAAGASLVFGKLNIDGYIGKVSTQGSSSSAGRVGMTYAF